MSLTVGVDTYNTLAETNAYYNTHFNTPLSWVDKTDDEKESLLKFGAILLDGYCDYNGYKTDEDQELEFPRNDETTIPKKIKMAHLEIVAEIANQNTVSAIDEAPLKKMKVDAIEFEFNTNEKTTKTYFNNACVSLLKTFCGSTSGFSSNSVIRT